MDVVLGILTAIYVVSAIGLSIFSLSIFSLLILWLIHHKPDERIDPASVDEWPKITVQLPIYNESAVVERLIRAVCALDYPRERLHIQVLDDSDDHTSAIIAGLVAEQQAQGVHIGHLRRKDRTEYKAGALQYGLSTTEGEFIAIFDADFVPAPDFLRQTVPHFLQEPQLGIVQCRWSHINAAQNLITRSQAMSIDGHFVVEQTARNGANLLLSFNGTGGLWRRSAIEDAGGWFGGTLAEDLDLSYRAQMRGWRYKYLYGVEVPAELPPQITAYKVQQARWAKGTTQTLRRLTRQLWRSPNLTLTQKIMGTIHLCQYMPQPLLLLMTLISPVLIAHGVLQQLPLAALGVVGLAAPAMYLVSQYQLYNDWLKRLIAFPLLIVIGSGILFNNSVAVMEAFFGHSAEFKRTPKFINAKWYDSPYALIPDWKVYGEMALLLYTAYAGTMALELLPAMVPFFWGQTLGLGAVVFWSMTETYRVGGRFRRKAHDTV